MVYLKGSIFAFSLFSIENKLNEIITKFSYFGAQSPLSQLFAFQIHEKLVFLTSFLNKINLTVKQFCLYKLVFVGRFYESHFL